MQLEKACPLPASVSIVVVVYTGELTSLRLQARSLARFFDKDAVREIVVLINDVDEDSCRAAVARILADYGDLAERVKIVGGKETFTAPHGLWRRYAVLDNLYFAVKTLGLVRMKRGWRGWRMQQAFKLASARVVTGDNILILDAKNFLMAPVTASDLFSEQGRARTEFVKPDRIHEKWLPRSCRALGLRAEPILAQDRVLGYLTPYACSRQVLMSTLKAFEEANGPVQLGMSIRRNSKKSTEFMLIAAQYYHRLGGFEAHFEANAVACCATGPEAKLADIRNIMAVARRNQAKIIGLHRLSWQHFDAPEKQAFRDLLDTAGLLSKTPDDERFLRNNHLLTA